MSVRLIAQESGALRELHGSGALLVCNDHPCPRCADKHVPCHDCEDSMPTITQQQVDYVTERDTFQRKQLSLIRNDVSLCVFLCIAIYLFLIVGAIIEARQEEGLHIA